MVVFHGIHTLADEFKGAVVTLGVYDGLHRAHMSILGRVIAAAEERHVRSLLITFNPHPRNFFTEKDEQVKLLTTAPEKIALLQDTALDGILFLTVDRELLNTESRTFVKAVLVDRLRISKVIVGYDYHFGRARSGHAEQLLDYGGQWGFDVEIVPPIFLDQEPVRSSYIRSLLARGDVERSAKFLNRFYSLRGNIVHGSGRGRRLGFPTANIAVESSDKLVPADGIYLTRCRVNGRRYFGMCNVGTRRTFDETERIPEVHLLDAGAPELYGSDIEVSFLERLRDEIKFGSADELVRQMHQDEKECRIRIEKYKL